MTDATAKIMIVAIGLITIAMSDFQKIRNAMTVLRPLAQKIKVFIWNKNLKIAYHKIRSRFSKNEFDESLDLDTQAMDGMNKEQFLKYFSAISKRRKVAHEKDLKKS